MTKRSNCATPATFDVSDRPAIGVSRRSRERWPMVGLSAREHQLTRKGVSQGVSIPWEAGATDALIIAAAGAQFIVTNPFANSETPKTDKGKAEAVENWLATLDSEIRGRLVEIGEDGIDQLNRRHLRALDSDTANMTGIRLAGYDRPMPQWLGQ